MIVVGVSDAAASNDPGEVLATYSLGSCIGVCLRDPVSGACGLLHYQLPESKLDPERARQNPYMYADSGLEALLRRMAALGASDASRIKVKLAGGATMLNDASMFNIGKRNHTAIRKILWQRGLFIESEDVGGAAPRTVYFRVVDGALTIKTAGETKVA